MQTRLAALESEVQRLRALNEKITFSVGTPEASTNAMGQPMPAVHSMDRPLSPPPEGVEPQTQLQPQHNLIPVTSEPPREESSGSGSDGGY